MNYEPQGIQQEGRPSQERGQEGIREEESGGSKEGIGRKKAFPIFSEEDADLRLKSWRLDKWMYARGNVKRNKKKTTQFAHHLVCERAFGRRPDWKGKREVCDHINRDKMDNRRENLRIVDVATNNRNKERSRYSSSVFPNTTWNKSSKKWQSQVSVDGKSKYLGVFECRIEAAKTSEIYLESLGLLTTNHPRH